MSGRTPVGYCLVRDLLSRNRLVDGKRTRCSLKNTSAEGEWQQMVLHFDSFEEARTKLLGLGAGVEVETPAVLRLSMLDLARQVVQRLERH